jgi:hypothetical protein
MVPLNGHSSRAIVGSRDRRSRDSPPFRWGHAEGIRLYMGEDRVSLLAQRWNRQTTADQRGEREGEKRKRKESKEEWGRGEGTNNQMKEDSYDCSVCARAKAEESKS